MKKDQGKITDFNTYRAPDETKEDIAFDRELRRKLVEDGLEEARRIQEDCPDENVGDSQELYLSIVQNLRDKGLWNEEAYEEAVREKQKKREEQVYDLLSEEDRYALERGRHAIQQEKKWKVRMKGFRRVAAGFLIIVGIFSLSMASDANREQAMRIWTTVTEWGQSIYISREKNSLDGVTKADDAIKEIKDKLGIDAPRFEYLPEHMEYKYYEIYQDIKLAKMTYSIDDNNFLYIYMTKEKTSTEDSHIVDGEIIGEFSAYIKMLRMNVTIEKIEQSENNYVYKTSFGLNNTFYILYGELKKEIFEIILNKLYL